MTTRRSWLVSYRVSLALVVPLLVLVTASLIVARSLSSTRDVVEDLAGRLFEQVSRQTSDETRRHLLQAAPTASLLPTVVYTDDADLLAARLLAVLDSHPELSWVSYSDADGSFTGAQRTAKGARRLNRSRIVDGKTQLLEEEIAADGSRRELRREADTGYDPRRRPFWQLAAQRRGRAWTPPYVFFEQGVPGITLAQPRLGPDGALLGVFTVDFDLNQLSSFVRGLTLSPRGRVFLHDGAGTLLAHPTLRLVETQGKKDEGKLVGLGDVADPALAAFAAAAPASGPFHFSVEGSRYLGSVSPVPVDDGLVWTVGVYAPEADFLGIAEAEARSTFWLSLGIVAVAVLVSLLLAQRIARPLAQLSSEMEKVGRFELEEGAEKHSHFLEVERMQAALVRMKGGLRSFASYVPRDLVRLVLASGQEAKLAGDVRVLTVFFSDLAGYTTLAEGLKPDALVQRLGVYLEEMTAILGREAGTVDKFLGDGIMAFWGAPLPDGAHAARACVAALRCQQRLAELDAKGLPFETRIGLATGEVLVGNIGSPTRLNYTVMGDTANLASRLEGMSKLYGTRILAAEPTIRAAGDAIVARPIDLAAVKGKREGVRVYELLAVAADADDLTRERAGLAESALDAYLARDFSRAVSGWERMLSLRPDDAAAALLLERARRLVAEPPGDDWTGVHFLREK